MHLYLKVIKIKKQKLYTYLNGHLIINQVLLGLNIFNLNLLNGFIYKLYNVTIIILKTVLHQVLSCDWLNQ